MNFKGSPQELGSRSSANLASPPFEMGNRSPPPLSNQHIASGNSSPPITSGPYSKEIAPSSSHLNVNHNINGPGNRNPSMNGGIDFQGLHIQDPSLNSPGYPNGNTDRSSPMFAQGAYNRTEGANQPASPRNYLAGFRELP